MAREYSGQPMSVKAAFREANRRIVGESLPIDEIGAALLLDAPALLERDKRRLSGGCTTSALQRNDQVGQGFVIRSRAARRFARSGCQNCLDLRKMTAQRPRRRSANQRLPSTHSSRGGAAPSAKLGCKRTKNPSLARILREGSGFGGGGNGNAVCRAPATPALRQCKARDEFKKESVDERANCPGGTSG